MIPGPSDDSSLSGSLGLLLLLRSGQCVGRCALKSATATGSHLKDRRPDGQRSGPANRRSSPEGTSSSPCGCPRRPSPVRLPWPATGGTPALCGCGPASSRGSSDPFLSDVLVELLCCRDQLKILDLVPFTAQ